MGQDQGVTRRAAIGMGAAAAAATVLAVSEAGASTAAADLTKPTISMAEAKVLIDAAVAKSMEIGVPMYILVVDEAGKEKASVRMDGNALAALTLVPLKAATAVSFRTATHLLGDGVAANPVRMTSLVGAGFTLLGGGLPIKRGDAVIGAIGVGGGSPEQDVVVGQAGLDALAAS